MTTPTENPTCKHCGQSKSDHHLANYADGSPITMNTLVCPLATFEAKTDSFGPKESEIKPAPDTTQPQLRRDHAATAFYKWCNTKPGPDYPDDLQGKLKYTWFAALEWRESTVQSCDCTKLRAILENALLALNVASPLNTPLKDNIREALATPCAAETNLSGGVEKSHETRWLNGKDIPEAKGNRCPTRKVSGSEVSPRQSCGDSVPPAQSLTPAQEKLCEQEAAMAYAWSDRNTRAVVLKHFLREALALREPQAGIGQPYTAQLERDNAELRRKLEETQHSKML
jgi:hypothetical protein